MKYAFYSTSLPPASSRPRARRRWHPRLPALNPAAKLPSKKTSTTPVVQGSSRRSEKPAMPPRNDGESISEQSGTRPRNFGKKGERPASWPLRSERTQSISIRLCRSIRPRSSGRPSERRTIWPGRKSRKSNVALSLWIPRLLRPYKRALPIPRRHSKPTKALQDERDWMSGTRRLDERDWMSSEIFLADWMSGTREIVIRSWVGEGLSPCDEKS